MAFENFVVGNFFPPLDILTMWIPFVKSDIHMSKVVGREKEERAPPLPDLLQVRTSNNSPNNIDNSYFRALDLEMTQGLSLSKGVGGGGGGACSPGQEEKN